MCGGVHGWWCAWVEVCMGELAAGDVDQLAAGDPREQLEPDQEGVGTARAQGGQQLGVPTHLDGHRVGVAWPRRIHPQSATRA